MVQLRDTTRRRKVQERLQVTVGAFEQIMSGIIILDCKGDIRWVNPAFTEITGYREEEVIGKNWRLLVNALQTLDCMSRPDKGISCATRFVSTCTHRSVSHRCSLMETSGGGLRRVSLVNGLAIRENGTAGVLIGLSNLRNRCSSFSVFWLSYRFSLPVCAYAYPVKLLDIAKPMNILEKIGGHREGNRIWDDSMTPVPCPRKYLFQKGRLQLCRIA